MRSPILARLLLPIALAAAPAVAQAGEVSLQKPLIWVHAMQVFPLEIKALLPYWSKNQRNGIYNGSLYPLLQEMGLQERVGRGWTAVDAASAKASGIDGFMVDVFTGDAGNYLAGADAVPGFHIAPCLDFSGVAAEKIESVAIDTIARNCAVNAQYPSSAQIRTPEGLKYLFFTYGTGMISPEGWVRVRAEIKRRGLKTFMVAAAESEGDLETGSQFPRERMAKFLPPFEAGYLFASAGRYWDDVIGLYHESGKPFFGGMMPGYYRVNGGYKDAHATSSYRSEWHRHLRTALPWVCLSTWNDLAENTEVMPNSDWNFTRSDITRFFAAKLRREPTGWKAPRLYITTPKAVYRGEEFPVEGLALNTSSRTLEVSVQLLDADRKPFGKPLSARVEPGEDGAATLSPMLKSFPLKRFLRAHATLREIPRAGLKAPPQVLASVLSAPILVLDASEQPGVPRTYYSIPAHKSLSGEVKITLSGRPLAGKTALASLNIPVQSKIRASEVLHNGAEVFNFLDATQRPVEVPRLEENGAIVGDFEWGFYMARVTDAKFRVGYSDPIYLAPPGDVSLWERFHFDEGSGAVVKDAFLYRKVGDLRDGAAFASPGVDGAGSCVRFDGKASWVDLRADKTPTGPLSIKFAVRPARLEGFLFADASGLWTEIDPRSGCLRFTRNTPGGFITVQGKTPLKVGEWARVEATYDGKMSRIFLNGALDGEVACPPGQPIGGQVLGKNPYGGGQFEGDMDDVEVRALPEAAG